MTTSILNQLDPVLYCKEYASRPVAGIVTRVTKTQARITLTDGSAQEIGPFKRDGWNGSHEAIGTYSKSYVYPATPEREAELIARAEAREQRKAEEALAREVHKRAIADEKARELAEAKAAWFAKDLRNPSSFGDVMPDGSRLYTIDIPVRPEINDRKKGWERLVVHCWDDREVDWDAPREADGSRKFVRIVESAYTYCNGSNGSFSSVSTNRHENDEAAVWDAIRRQYFGW